MNVYVDSSVLLRVVLGERDRLRVWPRISNAVSSELIRLECLRTIDRSRIRFDSAAAAVARQRSAVLEALGAISLVPIEPVVLERAADPFPTLIGAVDAIHLASAVLARDRFAELKLATHDEELGTAARAVGFEVFGTKT